MNKKWIYFDVDDTLILWDDYSGEFEQIISRNVTVFGTPHYKHIEILKRHKKFGKHTIVVWSRGGKEHAEKMLQKLSLTDYVDFVLAKPDCYYDDLPAEEFMKNRKYIKP